MTKVFKILGRIIGISLEWILIFLILFAFAIRTSPVQTFLAQKATDFLSKELHTTIHVEKVSVVFFDRLALDGILVLDQQKDTLAYIKTLYVNLDDYDLKKRFIKFDKAEIDQGTIHVNRDKETGDYNYWFITDYFTGRTTPSGKKPFTLRSKHIKLTDVNFKYDDYRKSYSPYGMDFDHLDLRHLNLDAKDIKSENGEISLKISKFSAKEKSGFDVSDFTANAKVSSKGIKIRDIKIKTPYSDIKAPKFFLLMNDYEDLQTVTDSVDFDGYLVKSNVSLKDVSYFATELEGMDQMVEVSGFVNNKIKNLKLRNLVLRTGKKTIIKGTFNLPDFRDLKSAFLNERVNYAYISLDDLKKIKMPKSSKEQYLSFDKYLERLGFFETYDLRLDGFYKEFVVATDLLNTNLGKIKIDNGVKFTENPKNNSYFFERSAGSTYDVKIDKFQLGKFLDDGNFGLVDGTFFLSGEAFSLADIRFNFIEGDLNRFDYLDYAYEGIKISEGSFVDKVFTAKIEIKDDNLNLVYDGHIDFKGNQHMEFEIDLKKAFLANLNLTEKDSTSLIANKVIVDLKGKNGNSLTGTVTMTEVLYKEGNKEIYVPDLVLNVTRSAAVDEFTITSSIANVTLTGKMNFNTLVSDFTDQFVKVFPSIIAENATKKKKTGPKSKFTYSVTAKDMNAFLNIFAPELYIAENTKLTGSYDGTKEHFDMLLTSPKVVYKKMQFETINLTQNLTANAVTADYKVNKFTYNDSVHLENVHFTTNGQQNALNSELSWNPNTLNESLIVWETNILDKNHLNFLLRPSFFSVNEQRWEIERQSTVSIAADELIITNFRVERNKQFVTIDGKLSHNDADKLNFKINDVNLSDVGALIGSKVDMQGVANGWGYISNPYTNLTYIGDANIQNLYLKNQEIGDVYVQSQWNKAGESIALEGDLIYRGNQTFKFDGSYWLYKETNNMDFNLVFDHTDIRFTNAFMDPDVVNNIKGLLDGRLKVTGSPDSPKLDGEIELIGGNARLDMLGVNFGFDGTISADEYGFYIDNMPVSDEEGNTGSLIGSIYHTQYEDWNFDLQFDLENDQSIPDSPLFNFGPNSTMDKFLVLNTEYEEGDLYYGKAYVTGTANIFGYADNIEITVDVETEKGTAINFPMYGVAELEEEGSFLVIEPMNKINVDEPPKIDFTGVDLDLNFKVTPDAKLRVIFNEQTGDEINVTGSGNMAVKLDNLGDLTLNGTYTVAKGGLYNFAMGPIKEKFHIEEGGTIAWTGNPYNAILNMRTYYIVDANISEIAPDEFQGSVRSSKQKVYAYIILSESLTKPTISFDIEAPKADETGRALLERVKSDPDELNRQFFSLMLWKKFQPLKGSTAAGGSAAFDLVTNQINALLSTISKDYKIGVNVDAGNSSGDQTAKASVSRSLLDDRLIITGSFGVEKNALGANQNALSGDVNLEYLLNESGTIRINVFNESNDNSVIQDKNLGLFTQGAGLHYQEDFDNFQNFKLAQYFLDIFRKKENKKYPVKRKKRQTPLPPVTESTTFFILPDNKSMASFFKV